jgi:hypothetical protein
MATLKCETYVTLTSADLEEILSNEICRYGIFDALKVTIVKQNSDGDFDLVLTPRPEEESA